MKRSLARYKKEELEGDTDRHGRRKETAKAYHILFLLISFSSLSGDLPFSCLEIISSQENVFEDLLIDNEERTHMYRTY